MKLEKIFVLLPLVLIACKGGDFKESKTFVGGKVVTAETLNLGQMTYMDYCVSCHGVKGDGQGIASKGMFPPPRNFTLGIYKFGYVASGELPSDADFSRIIKHGLNGTAMLPWDLSQIQLDALTQYIKTFASAIWEAKDKTIGEEVKLTSDPYTMARKDFAIQYGKEVYHAVGNCFSCHSAYATKDDILNWAKKHNQATPSFDDKMYTVKLQDSEHGYKALPPEFTWHHVRSANTVEELYLRLSSGVGGTTMPSWKGVLEDDQIWAVSYYVKSLMDLKNTKERDELFSKLK